MASPELERLLPPALHPSMTVGVVSPSSAVRSEDFERGIERLKAEGWNVVLGRHVLDRHGYLAGTDQGRARDLQEMIDGADVDAILCTRGGYGAWRIAESMDLSGLKKRPKLFVGYSDITTLHLAIERKTGLPTIYGPMLTALGAGLDEESERVWLHLATNPLPLGDYPISPDWTPISAGKAEGSLEGGCLSLLAANVGTPIAPDFTGRIVVLEDVEETVPHLDRYISQLIRGANLMRAAGVVIGTITRWDTVLTEAAVITPDALWEEYFAGAPFPVVRGFHFGHEAHPYSVPLGCLARLDADSGVLSVLESCVR